MGTKIPILFANKEERERRKKICDSCEHNKGLRCGVCNCFLIALQKLEIAECKLGKHDK